VDSSEFTVHLRAPGGPRVEETERQIAQIENMVRGHKADTKTFINEVALVRLLEDDEHLDEIRAANPDDGDLIDSIPPALAHNREEIRQLVRQTGEREFDVPGVVPPEDMKLMLSNIGVNARWSAIYTPNNGPHAAFLRVQLRSGFAGRTTG